MWEIIQAAGWPIWPLILTSVIGVAIILERFWSLRKSQIIPEGLMVEINTMIKQNDIDSNKLEILKNSSPLGDLLSVAISKRKNSVEIIKSALDERVGIIIHNLERYLGVLVTIATVAHFWGFLELLLVWLSYSVLSQAAGMMLPFLLEVYLSHYITLPVEL